MPGTHRDPGRPGDDEQPGIGMPADRRGTPWGMSQADIEARAAIAQALGKEVWPADRETLLLKAARGGAPEELITRLGTLPADETFENLQDVAVALGIGVESRRG